MNRDYSHIFPFPSPFPPFRLYENIKEGAALGEPNATSLARMRCWTRPVQCKSPVVLQQIKGRVAKITAMRANIEATLRQKEQAVLSVNSYEQHRSRVFNQSFDLGSQSTYQTMVTLKAHLGKLKKLRQFVVDRCSIESDYARMLEDLARSCVDGASEGHQQPTPLHHRRAGADTSVPTDNETPSPPSKHSAGSTTSPGDDSSAEASFSSPLPLKSEGYSQPNTTHTPNKQGLSGDKPSVAKQAKSQHSLDG
jgi:hypothetical protein